MPETTYTYPEAAERLGIGESTLHRWVAQGRITCVRLGARLVRFTEADLASAFTRIPPHTAAAAPARRRRHT